MLRVSEVAAKAVISSCSLAYCDTDKRMTQATIPRRNKNNIQMPLGFAPKNHSKQRKMNLSASCPLHMQIISDQLMNGAIFHSCETVITKGIET